MMASTDDCDMWKEELEISRAAKEKNGLITLLLSQAVETLRGICNGIEGDMRGYKVTDPSTFMNLLKKSRALVDYVDHFVLESDSDKIVQVRLIGEYNCCELKRYYGHLRYATGILNTIVTECRWKTIPAEIKKRNQVNSLVVAMEVTEELAQYSEEPTKLLEEAAAARAEESGAKSGKRKMMD